MLKLFKSKIFIRQFTSIFFILLVIFIAISLVLLTTTRISMENQQKYIAENYRAMVSKEIDEWLEERVHCMKNEAMLLEKIDESKYGSEEIRDLIKKQVISDENLLDILIIDKDGIVLNQVDNDGKLDLSHREYFINGMKGKSTITGFYKGAKTGHPVMAVGEPIFIKGQARYVVAAIIGLERMKEIVEELSLGYNGHAYLVSEEGMLITDSNFIEEYIKNGGIKNKEKYKVNSPAVEQLLKQNDGTGSYTDFAGDKVFGSYKWFDAMKVGLIVELKAEKAMRPLNDLIKVLCVLAVVVAVIGFLLAFLFSRRLISPINKLISAAENIMESNYGEKLDFNTGTELDIFVRNFNKMQEAIHAREVQLERKNEELRVQTAEALEANRLKSQFLANMSHELRTPLNSIIGFTTRVIKKCSDSLPVVQLENLKIVKEEALHLLELINNLLDYSKIEAGKMDVHIEGFDLREIIDEVSTMTKPLMDGKKIEYRQSIYTNEIIPIHSDRLKVKQVLINLISNAFKYSEKGIVKLSVDAEGSYFIIKVEDQGVGIPPENLQNIFDEFRQVDGSYTRKVGGTGLGLSITKRFTEMLGGSISVASQLGVGSCFTVLLPRESMACDEWKSKHEEDGRKRVICVDDDPNVQRLYRQYLDEYGFDVITLDGKENITAKIMGLKPDVIILDIIMPYRDGWDILAELKSIPQTRNIPIIMASILSEKNLAYKMKADEYLIKPITQDELVSTITQLIYKKEKIDVLIAEDDDNYLRLMGQYLHEKSIGYRSARDGEEAITLMERKKPDIILLDLMMPKKDGFDVVNEITRREEWKNIPVIVLTSKLLSADEKEFLKNRVRCVIEKSGSNIEVVMGVLLGNIKEKAGYGKDSAG